jgi:DNA replication initiation complex subunit (GINS family)
MYDELYNAWKHEVSEPALGVLPRDFYERITGYLRKIKEENRLIDQKNLKATLLEHEVANVRRMIGELLWARYKKLVKLTTQTQKLPIEALAFEEAQIFESFLPFTEAYQKFSKGLLQGQVGESSQQEMHKRIMLRFSKNIPQIMGSDMKTYGPFIVEDIASLPIQNAKVFVKQGLAIIVDVA